MADPNEKPPIDPKGPPIKEGTGVPPPPPTPPPPPPPPNEVPGGRLASRWRRFE